MKRSTQLRRKGSVLYLCALVMVGLLGCAALVVDYSTLLADRNRLQRACDAGALAGASYLNRTGVAATDRGNVIEHAVEIGRRNGLSASEITSADVTLLNGGTQVRVSAHRTRQLFFIRVLGIYNGVVTATATAGTQPFMTPQVVPIGITPETANAYANDTGLHDLTLSRPQDTPFYQSLSPSVSDPFVLTDYRSDGDDSTHGSPDQMERQLTGVDRIPVSIGNAPSSLRASLNAQSAPFESGIGTIFARATAAPWNDPLAGLASPAWKTVGSKYFEIVSGASPSSNPRIVNLFITPGLPVQSGNCNYPVLGFIPVYIESVTDDAGVVKMSVRFFSPASGLNSQPVGLIE